MLFKKVKAGIPLNSVNAETIDTACKLLEKYNPENPVEVKVFNDRCVTVMATYNWFNGLRLNKHIKNHSIDYGFRVRTMEG